MRYPNLRYGNPNELRYYGQNMTLRELAKMLRRSERSVHDWLTEKRKVPWWVPELLRLRAMERAETMRQMGFKDYDKRRLGVVKSAVLLEFPEPARPAPVPVPALKKISASS